MDSGKKIFLPDIDILLIGKNILVKSRFPGFRKIFMMIFLPEGENTFFGKKIFLPKIPNTPFDKNMNIVHMYDLLIIAFYQP